MKVIIFCKDVLRLILCGITDYLAKKNPVIQGKKLVILRLDVIGDYVLFRNFLEIIRSSSEYKGYEVTLIGNSLYRNLAEGLDGGYVDNFIFINTRAMTRNYLYRYKIIKKVTAVGYDVLICPTYSRDFFVNEFIVKSINSRNKIGIVANLTNMSVWQRSISNCYYTRLINTQKEVVFEFCRTKYFFEELLNCSLSIEKPLMELGGYKCGLELSKKYIVFFIGATNLSRRWSIDNFMKVAQNVLVGYPDINIVVCGGASEKASADKFFNIIKSNRVKNYVGRTTLMDLSSVISKSLLLLSNESSAPHIASSLGVSSIVLYNGANFKRFTPYPKKMIRGYFPVYHDEIEKDYKKYEIVSNERGFSQYLNINDIGVGRVMDVINNMDILSKR